MWMLKLSLTTVWMAGTMMGWTLLGLWHLLAVAVVVLEFSKGTRLERRIAETLRAVVHRLRARTLPPRALHGLH